MDIPPCPHVHFRGLTATFYAAFMNRKQKTAFVVI